ncbi:galectin-1-like [Rana temporaria]|uniref:galectin-1-like n=1 Tax=Rana temporaria TaxID=8407 RepID=UPI001AAD005A|nr:galectin-1-like [Rana temporaria]
MADSTSLKLRPGNCVEVEGVIPQGCKMFFINLGKDKNLVIHFMARFDFMGHKNLLIMNSMVDGVYGAEQKETVFPFQEGKDTMICFQFEKKDKITIQLLEGKPFSFPVRLPIEEISYFAVQNLQLKSIIVK